MRRPVKFLIFINDLESDVRNIILKFADATKVLGKVNVAADGLQLQEDFNRFVIKQTDG